MQGFHPQTAGKKPVKNYANGGIVKGPGTGTSDEVPAVVPKDGYVMPADSVQALGFKPGMREVNLSNGEAVLTPEQVQAAGGFQALDQMRAATHTPVPEQGQEAKVFFANGGPLDEEQKPFMPVLPQSLQNGMTKMYSAGLPPVGAGDMSAGAGRGFSVPSVPPVTRERDIRQAQMAAEASQRAASQAATNARYADVGAQEAAAARAAFSAKIGNSAVRPYRDPAAAVAPSASQVAVTAPPATPTPGAAQAMAKPATPPAARPPITPPAQAPSTAPSAAGFTPGNVNARRQANGVMEFSGQNISGDVSYAGGFKPRGAVSAQNMAAADALAGRYQQEAQASMQPQGQSAGPRAFVGADTGGFGLLDKTRIQQRNLQMDVQQLKPGASKALKGFLQQQAEAPVQQIERERLAADTQLKTADLAQRGEESRATLGFRAGQLANDNARTALEGQKVASDIEARGFDINQAKRMQKLQEDYLAAKTPAEQAAAAAKINALSGKAAAADEYMAVGGGETVDARGFVTKNPDVLVNKRTGQPVQGGQGGQKQLPPMATNPQAIAIKNDANMTREQKAEALRQLGYR